MPPRSASRSRSAAPASPQAVGVVRPHDITRELRTSFLDYSMSVIVQRALPDARDGLKPVQRRILQTMLDEGLAPGRAHKKCATVVGTALGRYHPHGDASVYDALVRLAQDFSLHEPLVDGQGNFGSIDGDSAAAYRYTEARMTAAAHALCADLEKGTVDFRPNFDGRYQEPVVMPAKLPNLLLNGGEGIAVGMATKIPPHNLKELAAAIDLLCESPHVADEAVLAKVKGPDFPTGGQLIANSELKALYRTGKGKLTLRAKAHVETMRNGRSAIVITEIPYGVMKNTLISAIVDMVKAAAKVTNTKGVPWNEWIADLGDESDHTGIRMVIECAREADPAAVLDALYAKTKLQITYGAQLLALVDGAPTLLTLRRALEVFIAHRLDVIVRRARFELAEAERRAHVLQGLLIAIKNIDAVVALIKGSKDRDAAKVGLKKSFKLSDVQADAVLSLQLARLTTLDVSALKSELAEKEALIAALTTLLARPTAQREVVRAETRAMAEQFARARRTQIVSARIAESAALVTVEHRADILLTMDGALRTAPEGERPKGTRSRVWFRTHVGTAEQAVLFTDAGKVYPVSMHDASATGAAAHTVITGMLAAERALWMAGPADFADTRSLLFILANGMVKRTATTEYLAPRAGGVASVALQPDDRLLAVLSVRDEDEILLATANGKAIRFVAGDVPLQGRVSRGVWGIRPADGDAVVSGTVLGTEVQILTAQGLAKRVAVAEFPVQKRGGQGVVIQPVSAKSGPVAVVVSASPKADLVVLTGTSAPKAVPARDIVKARRDQVGTVVPALAGATVTGALVLTDIA